MKWIAKLSSGEIIIEKEGKVAEHKGGKSSWLQLLDYISSKGVQIVRLGLLLKDSQKIWVDKKYKTDVLSYHRKVIADIPMHGTVDVMQQFIIIGLKRGGKTILEVVGNEMTGQINIRVV